MEKNESLPYRILKVRKILFLGLQGLRDRKWDELRKSI